jgi:hypothetical protein
MTADALRRAVLDRLDYLDRLAAEADQDGAAMLAKTEVPHLTASWRDLLTQHQPRDERCPRCSRRRRARRVPCPIWATAHHHLVGE